MTRLITYDSHAPYAKRYETSEFAEIVEATANIGINLERLNTDTPFPAMSDEEGILAAYAADIRRLQIRGGYQSFDLIRLTPDDPERAESRKKFLSEHTHADDEVRYCIEGQGQFYIRAGDYVHALEVTAGDLISVPTATLHWFDGGERPSFTAIRLFTTPDGWAATFTGGALPEDIPLYEGKR